MLRKVKKGSIQSWEDFSIAMGVLVIALVVISLITMPVLSLVISERAYNNCCEKIGDLPENSTVWLCQYLVFYTDSGTVIRMDLNNEKTWSDHSELIYYLTGLKTKDEWTIFCIDMLNNEYYVEQYLIGQNFDIVSCSDCEEFYDIVKVAIDENRPLKIVMYDCCCNICPFIVPVFIY